MNQTKESVTALFESIQYQSEIVVSELSKREYSLQSRQFKKVLIQTLNQKLSNTRERLLLSRTLEDIQSSLPLIEADYRALFKDVHAQIEKLDQGKDISDYIYHLKHEMKDIMYTIQQKVKGFFQKE